ncbi:MULTISPECIES: hypothetical protein [Methylorubrum]|jgi:hypothetical protein|nr:MULTISPECIES: hypothetical protein [Methylorubrum]EHP92289.1 hypothetical protein MetexDRAFT_2805 [Methylorubrum extorquens DSM 13060]BDL39783.1 hypothetical protein MSPGM_23730 [Methylorubrum sp. GM97]
MRAVMRALPFVGLAFVLLGPAAEARPARQHVAGSEHAVLAPLEEAATACFAETVVSNPKAMRLARDGRWYEAAGVTGFLCRPEVDRMAVAHDRIYGPGTGARYFKGAYARHLDKQLAARLQPVLETKAMASAEPPAEKAALIDSAMESAPGSADH